jgi:bifunctional non-homologous end joining protein LigD
VALEEYRRKRDFTRTPEPSGDGTRHPAAGVSPKDAPHWDALPHGRRFCVQQHRATRMHYDFRLEHNGVLLSWPIPRGPTLDPKVRRLAVHTEDHPVDYGDFEGVIPSGYGAGTVLLWDIGTYEWVRETAADVEASLARGDLKFRLVGSKLAGEFALVKLGNRGRGQGGRPDGDNNWLMIKKRDEHVVEGYDAAEHEVSVKTGRTLAQIAADGGGDPREMARAARAARSAARAPGSAQAATATEEPQVGTSATSTSKRRARSQPEAPTPAMPDPPAPMLATSVDRPFTREGWLFELKWDGVRALAAVDRDAITVKGRNGRDETARYPELSALTRALRGHRAIVDGEIVVLDDDGRPSFERLQTRINVSRDADVRRAMRDHPATYVVFDLLWLDDRDLVSTALRIRKKTLKDVLTAVDGVVYVDDVERDGEDFFAAVRSQGIEGMVGKRADSTYQAGRRSPDWLKVKSWQTQSCVIAGWTTGRGRRASQLGALILGVYEGDQLLHCGQVGTGFDAAMLTTLRAQLGALLTGDCPLRSVPRTTEPATWVRPALVCEVRHAGWTRQGILRHPAFVGLRVDVRPQDCRREVPTSVGAALAASNPPAARGAVASTASPTRPAPAPRPRRAGSDRDAVDDGGTNALLEQLRGLADTDWFEVEGRRLRLTHLDKPIWPADGLTKRDLVAHYLRVARVLLPYLRDRPLSMQVFPDGIDGKSFWRKDKPGHAPGWIQSWTYHGEKTKEYVVVNELATLVWVANAASIDLHPWHSRIDAPEQPDWAVFDLDPAEGATFASVVTLARLVGVALDHYGLHSAVKTTGQTGLQIYVPVRRGPDYTAVRSWVEGVSRAVGKTVPDLVSWEWSVRRRTGRVRLDYTQNIINKTLTAPYTVRAEPRAPVSAPITWADLEDPALAPDRWNIHTIGARLAEVGDLFTTALAGDQDLPPLD